MWQKIWLKMQTTVFGGAVIVGSSWVVSKILGLLRQRLIASTFGNQGADPIYAAFAVPDFIYGTLILGSLLTAFMPVFIAYRQKDEAEAWRISRTIITVLFWLFAVLGLILLTAAEPIVHALVGSKIGAAAITTTITLTRIMSVTMLFFAVSNVFSGILQSYKHFFAISLAPIVNNLGIIFGVMVLVPIMGTVGVAWGAVLGAMMHALVTAIAAWRVGWRPGAGAGWKHPGVRQVGNLLLPRTVGQSVAQINQLVNIPIATRLGPGNLSIFRWANDIQDVPINIIGVTMATVSFPIFVELLAQNKKEEFIKHFSTIVRQILFLIIPITVLFIQLRAQFVRLIIGAGEISWPVTIATAQTVAYFALSFFAQALIPVLARSFYAMQDTKTPVRITVGAVGLDIIGSLTLGPLYGVEGLALSFSISSVISAAWLMIALHKRVGALDEEKIFSSVLKILGVTMLMGLTVQGAKYFLDSFGLVLTSGFAVLVQALVAGGIGVLAYVAFSILFKIEEAAMLSRGWDMFRALFRPTNGKGTVV